jgi:hypothetical protein
MGSLAASMAGGHLGSSTKKFDYWPYLFKDVKWLGKEKMHTHAFFVLSQKEAI